MQEKNKIKIDRQISITKLLEDYPFLEEVLTLEYGFHCASCMFAEFDTLEDGASLHGIEGEYFEELLSDIETRIQEKITEGNVPLSSSEQQTQIESQKE